MPILLGDVEPLDIRAGDIPALAVYLGDTLVWSPSSISLDAVGPGVYHSFGSVWGGSAPGQDINPYNHPGGSPDCVIGVIGGYRGSSLTLGFEMTYGGVAMTPIGGTQWGNNSSGSNSSFFQWFGLMNPPAGTQEVVGYWYGSGFASPYITVNTVSFDGVGSWLGPYSDGGTETGTELSQTVSSGDGEVILQSFVQENSGASMPGPANYSEIPLFNIDGAYAQGVVGRALGAESVTFTADRYQSGQDYLETAIRLLPA